MPSSTSSFTVDILLLVSPPIPATVFVPKTSRSFTEPLKCRASELSTEMGTIRATESGGMEPFAARTSLTL